MATTTQVKVKIFNLPTKLDDEEDGIEEEIEDEVKKRVDEGYTFDKMVCNPTFVMLVFLKTA